MDFKTKKADNATVEITVEHNAAEVAEAFEKAYLRAQKKVKIPGFRPGKAPLEMVRRKLGDSVAEDAARDLISTTFDSIVDKLDPPPIALPRFDIEEFDRDKGAKYVGHYDTSPEVKAGKYKKIRATLAKGLVEESSVESELNRLRDQHTLLRNREEDPIILGDFVTLDITLTDNGTEIFSSKEFHAHTGSETQFPSLDENLVGKKAGDTISYTAEVGEDFPDARFAGKSIAVSGTIAQVLYPEYPELNDAFAKEHSEFDTMEEFRNSIRKKMEEATADVLRRRAFQSIVETVVADSKFVIPQTPIRIERDRRISELGKMMQMESPTLASIARVAGQSEESLEKDLTEMAEKSVKERLILQEVIKSEKIEVSPDEIIEESQKNWGHMLTEERLADLLDSEELREELESRLLFRKCVDYLLDSADLKEGEKVTFETLAKEGAFGRN